MFSNKLLQGNPEIAPRPRIAWGTPMGSRLHSGQIFDILRNRTVSATNPSGFTHSQLWCTTHSQLWVMLIYVKQNLHLGSIFTQYTAFLPFCFLFTTLSGCTKSWMLTYMINIIFFFQRQCKGLSRLPFGLSDNWWFHWKKLKTVWYIHMNLDRTGFLPNTMSPSGSKHCHQTPSVPFYSRSNLYLNAKKKFKIIFFFKKPIQAIMPQDHLRETCNVTYMHPSHHDPRWQTRQHQGKTFISYFLNLYLVLYLYYNYNYHP